MRGKAQPVVLHESWLVQRLQRPWGDERLDRLNPFAFGGGLKNGGLSDDAMTLLSKLFRFDYMGAAEFEYGAVPKALQRIAEAPGTYNAFEFTIPLSEVEKDWRDKSKTAPSGEATVYVICPAAHAAEIEQRIRGWAAGNARLKERTMLAESILLRNDWDRERCGWLELDNGFFFFTDKAMWQNTARLFGVAQEA